MTTVSSGSARWRVVLDVVVSVVLIAAAGTFLWRTFRQPSIAPPQQRMQALPTEPIAIGDSASKGHDGAQIVLVEFSDFECPFCGKFAREILPAIQREYVDTGKVKLVFKHLPLTIHPLANEAAKHAECAGQQGRFWQFHDALFSAPSVSKASLDAAAQASGVATPVMETCLEAESGVQAQIDDDLAMAKSYSVGSTPTFFLGYRLADGRVKVTKAVNGAQPIDVFRAAIDEANKRSARNSLAVGGKSS